MRYGIAFLALACGLVLFTGLGSTGFLDVREARDAQVARELLAARERLTPVFGSEPLFDKPVFAYAIDTAARWLNADSLLASRLIRALLAVLMVALVGSIGAVHFGARAGWCAAAVLTTTLSVPLAVRTDGTQLLATLFSWVGAGIFAESLFEPRRGREQRLALGYVALATAMLVGGVLSLAWPLGALGLFRVLEGRRSEGIALGTGLWVVVGLALPWHLAMFERHGVAFLEKLAFFPYAAEPRAPWYAGLMSVLSFLVVGLFPWSALLPGAFAHSAVGWRTRGSPPPAAWTREQREERAAHFIVACFLTSLLTLLWYPSAPLSAILPAAPAAALLCGRFLDHAIEDASRLAADIARAAAMLALLGTITAVLLTLVAGRLADVGPALRLLATVLFVAAWAPLLAALARRPMLAAALMVLPVAAGTPVATLRVLPDLEPYLSTRAAMATLEAHSPPLATLVLFDPPTPSMRLYGEHNLVVADDWSRIAAHVAADGWIYLGFRPARERDIQRRIAAPLEILQRTPALIIARVQHP
jgi:4-amino-4-deoxy-L-arabinose transferase-like glycosyltransferase